MLNTTVTNFRKDIFNVIENTIKYSEPVTISTKSGNAILLSEEEYNSMLETLYISSVPGLKEQLLEDMEKPTSDFLTEDEVDW